MRITTLGPDENGWTYTITARSGILVGNATLDKVYSYTRKSKSTYFTLAHEREREREDDTQAPYEKITVTRSKCERQQYGLPKENYTTFKFFLLKHDETCVIKKFRLSQVVNTAL